MLAICEVFAKEYDVMFNSSKSVLLFFYVSEQIKAINAKLNGMLLYNIIKHCILVEMWVPVQLLIKLLGLIF